MEPLFLILFTITLASYEYETVIYCDEWQLAEDSENCIEQIIIESEEEEIIEEDVYFKNRRI